MAKDARIEIRLKPEQKRDLQRMADDAGTTLSEYVRQSILEDEDATDLTKAMVSERGVKITDIPPTDAESEHDPAEGYLASDT